MHDHKIRVKSDHYKEYKEEMEDMGKMSIDYKPKVIPVDLNGRQVFLDKDDPSNFEDAKEEVENTI